MKNLFIFNYPDAHVKEKWYNLQIDLQGFQNLFDLFNNYNTNSDVQHRNVFLSPESNNEKESSFNIDTYSFSSINANNQIHQRCKFSEIELQESNETFFNHIEMQINPKENNFWTLTYNQHFSFTTYNRTS